MIRFVTAGESHGPMLMSILEGIPAGLPLTAEDINRQLARRQQGYGRGGRMKIETDRVQIVAGVRGGATLGSPIGLLVENKDWSNWEQVMTPGPGASLDEKTVTRPRPGHADLAGGLKYRQEDLRNVLERASARETAMRVAAGAVARKFLAECGVNLCGFVRSIGSVEGDLPAGVHSTQDVEAMAAESELFCPDKEATERMKKEIDNARAQGDTLGGVYEIWVEGLPPGLGSHIQWDLRLDGLLAQALMSIPATKGVEVGAGFANAFLPGSEAHDEIFYTPERGYHHATNRAGGLEGGITNGETLVVRAAMKPIPSLLKPLRSIDIKTREPVEAAFERSDVCAVPAASVVAEAMVALVVAGAYREKFGGDHMEEVLGNLRNYREYLKTRG